MNTNVLAGVECPVCGSEDRFVIEMSVVGTVTDNGIEESYDFAWAEDSLVKCGNYGCEHFGVMREFQSNK